MDPLTSKNIIRLPAELKYRKELMALKQNDTYPKPPGWFLSPTMVELYVLGSNKQFSLTTNGKTEKVSITPKFFGSKDLIQKSIVTLASRRALMLIGEPGTGKSWLSEHLAAAISGKSTNLIQGTAGTTEDQIRYTWNYALLIAEGPSEQALVPSPTMIAMREGQLLRLEELTRCPQEIQDTLISVLSEKVLPVPELGKDYYVTANQGFNVIATANDRDRGVNEMSAALKRRFNFIYIPVINDPKIERQIVETRVQDMMETLNFKIQIPDHIYSLVTTSFRELRNGKSKQGQSFKKISSVMSTSEEISLLFDSCIHTQYFGKQKITPREIALHLSETIVKDDPQNIHKLQEYLDLVLSNRARKDEIWKEFHRELKKQLKLIR
ncbi:MAG: AAA domain-containing protein [Candidatus Lokiarchaeota archaeon]|nr:AAA domain-containing protein [Candidatus Lokiarchaeota archaeon]